MQLDMKELFGTPTLAFVKMEIYYEQRTHADDPIYKADRKWFASHPNQSRVVRPARGNEFQQNEAHIIHNGKRVSPPQLWVRVEPRFGIHDFVVCPIYRGPCFWEVDSQQYLIADVAGDDSGNYACDKLLYRMHHYGGVHQLEMEAHAEKLAETMLALAAANQQVN